MMDLNGYRVAIIATDGFEQSELLEPRRALDEARASVTVIAPKKGDIQGYQHFDKGQKVKVDQTLEQSKPEDFDAVMLPGGALNADALRMNKSLQNFLRGIHQAGKPTAAICHAPWELISADLVRGRTLTSYYTIQDDVRNAGATWVDREVAKDGNLVTSRNPGDLKAFSAAMLNLFSEHKQATAKVSAAS